MPGTTTKTVGPPPYPSPPRYIPWAEYLTHVANTQWDESALKGYLVAAFAAVNLESSVISMMLDVIGKSFDALSVDRAKRVYDDFLTGEGYL